MIPITTSMATSISVAAGSGQVLADIRNDQSRFVINLTRLANAPSDARQALRLAISGPGGGVGASSSLPDDETAGRHYLNLKLHNPRKMKHIDRIAGCIDRIVSDTGNSRDQRNTIRHLYAHGQRWASGAYAEPRRNDAGRAEKEAELMGALRFVYTQENRKAMPKIKL